jgi:hypothetical protein
MPAAITPGTSNKIIVNTGKPYLDKSTVQIANMTRDKRNNLSTPFSLNAVTMLRIPVAL